MAAQDKTVKITIAVDEASAAKARRAIAEITSEVSRLVEMTSKLGGLFGGGGGGNGAIRVSAMAGQPGQSAATQIQHQAGRAGAGVGGAVSGLTAAAQGSAQVFRTAAAGSQTAFRTMQDGMRTLADAGEREVRRMERSFGRLAPLLSAGRADVTRMRGTPDLRSAGMAEIDRLRGGGGGGAGGGDPGAGGRAAGEGLLARLQPLIRGVGVGAMIGFAGDAFRQASLSNMSYSWQQPMFASSTNAQAGQIFGGQSQALRHGDVARAFAMSQVATEDNTHSVVGKRVKDNLERSRSLRAPVSFMEHVRAGEGVLGMGKGALSWLSSGVGASLEGLSQARGVGDVWNWIKSDGSGRAAGGMTFNEMRKDSQDRRRLEANESMEQAKLWQQRVENKMSSDPMFMERLNNFYSGSMGAAGLARAGGFGGDFAMRKINGKMKAYDTIKEFEAGAIERGYSGHDRASANQRLGAAAGRGLMHGGLGLLDMEAGGLHNAAMLSGVGAQFGGGKGAGGMRSFMRSFQGQIGRGGVDVTAGNQVGGIGAGAMLSGNFQGTTGSGFMSTMLDATFTGTPGGDMHNAAMMGAGLGATDRLMSGGIDPLQKALNFSAAMKVAGNKPWATKAALTNLDTASAFDIVRSGKVPMDLQVRGITVDMVKQYLAAQNQTAFSRVSSKMLSSEQNSAVAAYKKGGIRGAIGGLQGEERERRMRALSTSLQLGTGDSTAGAYMRVRLEASREGLLGGRKRAGGSHSSFSLKSTRGRDLGDQASEQRDIGMEDARDMFDHEEARANRKEMQKHGEAMRKKAQAGGDAGTMSGAIDNVAAALQAFVAQIRAEGSPGRAGGPPQGSASR